MDATTTRKSFPWSQGFLLLVAFVILIGVNYTFVKASPSKVDFLNRWLPVRLVLFEGYEDLYGKDV